MAALAHKTCSKCGVSKTLRNFTSPKGRVCVGCQKASRKASSRNRHVEEHYGLTAEEYAALVEFQGGCCHMCGEQRRPDYPWHVDHDHVVERLVNTRASIRGLICARCNTLLRKARDNASVLYGGGNFLTAWPTSEIFDFVQGYTA